MGVSPYLYNYFFPVGHLAFFFIVNNIEKNILQVIPRGTSLIISKG